MIIALLTATHIVVALILVGILPSSTSFAVRFTSPALNYWSFVLFCTTLPVTISLFIGLSLKSTKARVVAILVLLIPSSVPLAMGFLAIPEARHITRDGYEKSSVLLDEVKRPGDNYRLYLTNCGATCAYGLSLRQERETSVGLKFVRHIWGKKALDTKASLRFDPPAAISVIEKGKVTHTVVP